MRKCPFFVFVWFELATFCSRANDLLANAGTTRFVSNLVVLNEAEVNKAVANIVKYHYTSGLKMRACSEYFQAFQYFQSDVICGGRLVGFVRCFRYV